MRPRSDRRAIPGHLTVERERRGQNGSHETEPLVNANGSRQFLTAHKRRGCRDLGRRGCGRGALFSGFPVPCNDRAEPM